MKKTALDEDALLYQKRDERPDRERLRDMSFGEKLGFLKDYYLLPALVVLAVAAGVIYTVRTMTRPVKQPWIYIALINAVLDEETSEDLENRLTEFYQKEAEAAEDADLSSRDSANIEFPFDLDRYSDMMRFQTYAAAGQIDLILASEDVFAEQAGRGVLLNLEEVLSREELEEHEKSLLYTAGYNDELEDETEPDAAVGTGEILPYGVRIPENSILGSVTKTIENPVIGILPSTNHMEDAKACLRLLLKTE